MSTTKWPAFDEVIHDQYGEIVYYESVAIVSAEHGLAAVTHPSLKNACEVASELLPKLKLEERIATLVKPSPILEERRWQVKCIFRLQRAKDVDKALSQRGGSTLNQIKTGLDKNGDPIQITCTPSGGGPTVTENVEFDVWAPQQSFEREVVLATGAGQTYATPDALVAAYIGRVNQTTWHGETAGMWLCMAIHYEPADMSTGEVGSPPTEKPQHYRFTFHFEKADKPESMGTNQAGWRYTQSYRDAQGKVPSDVSPTNGMAVLNWHQGANFSELFS